jgi:putative membrane protein
MTDMRAPTARFTALVTALAAAGIIAAPAVAQKPAADPGTSIPRAGEAPGRAALGAQERKFVTEAAMGGLHEVEAGQLAATKAAAPEVKAFAQRMVTDHGKANEELKRIAAQKNVQLPTQLDRKHRTELDRLQKLSGAAFDREYMKHMLEDHKNDVTAFRKAAQDLKDAEVKQFASTTLPTLEAHLDLAQKTAENAKAERGGKAASAKR